jgi:RsfA family transcription factor
MSIRKDNWTEADDNFLVATILEHIVKGLTQLEAFTHAGNVLGRTESACGFRWNSTLRHKYTEHINEAKEQRQKYRKNGKKAVKARELEKKLPGYSVTPVDTQASRFKPVSEVVYYDVRMSGKEIQALKKLLDRAKLPLDLKELRADLNTMK